MPQDEYFGGLLCHKICYQSPFVLKSWIPACGDPAYRESSSSARRPTCGDPGAGHPAFDPALKSGSENDWRVMNKKSEFISLFNPSGNPLPLLPAAFYIAVFLYAAPNKNSNKNSNKNNKIKSL